MKVDEVNMTATTKDGVFPIERAPSGALRFVVRPTPGTVAPTDEEHAAAVAAMKARYPQPKEGGK